MSRKPDDDSGHPRSADASILQSVPAGYDPAGRVVTVRSGMTERQFRTVERILGHPRFWLGRHKVWADMYVFTPATAPMAEALCTYLREQEIPHEYETTYRWLASEA